MAKLQKQVSRKVGDKEYSKYVIVIPEENIKESGLKVGEEIKIESSKNKIILTK